MTPIPPLELAIRVAELGGWARVQVMARYDSRSPPEWQCVAKGQVAAYLNPHDRPLHELWKVYDVRKRCDDGKTF